MTVIKEANIETYEKVVESAYTEVGCAADAASCCGGSEN